MNAATFDARALLRLWDPETDPRVIAEVLGVGKDTVRKWRTATTPRRLNPWTADRYAIRAGTHPARVWPEWVEVALRDN